MSLDAERPINRAVVEQILTDYELAKRALKWMIEHKVYWEAREERLLHPVSLEGRRPLTAPPPEVLAYLHQVVLEAALDAEHVG